ncbi:MAG: CPBP family glutamic-type intramembrane protease [Planctomycetota bacterium]
MTIIFELLAVICLVILPCIPAHIFYKRAEVKEHTRYPYIRLALSVLKEFGVIFFLLYITMHQPGRLLSIGIDFTQFENSCFGGLIVLGISAGLYAIGHRIVTGKKPEIDYSQKHIQTRLSYRKLSLRALYIVNLVLVSIEEEMIFRGYFILLWGQRTNAVILFALISGTFFIAIHLYQGKKAIAYHILFTAGVTISTILSDSIMIAISAHIFHNLISSIGLWHHETKKRRKELEKEICKESFHDTDLQRKKQSIIVEPPKPLSRLALVAFIFSTLGLITLPFTFGLLSIISLVLGIKAKKNIKRNEEQLSGSGLAIGAIAISLIPVVIAIFIILIMVFLLYVLPFLLSLFADLIFYLSNN